MLKWFRRGSTTITAGDILDKILSAKPQATAMAPRDCRGIYGLVDHHGDLRYIGSTSSAAETFYKRIHQRHRTGSETTSHYFSRMYNTGRMWRLRNDPATKADGDIAKKLRNAFIAEHCQAVWVPLPDDLDIAGLEAEVIELAPREVVAWNRRGMEPYEEPEEFVDLTIDRLGFGTRERAAIERQRSRFRGGVCKTVSEPQVARRIQEFPRGPFRFVALDVETANHDRASICQIGVACVSLDNSIETWVTYVDPQTSRWAFTGLHGISDVTVAGAPTFAQVLPVLETKLAGVTIYQHSGFDRSAIRQACSAMGRPEPAWCWKDSVTVARKAWPELKGRGGHGLASLQTHLGLTFDHHDAGEDARAAAEIVLLAEGSSLPVVEIDDEFDVIDEAFSDSRSQTEGVRDLASEDAPQRRAREVLPSSPLGTIRLTSGNIRNSHFYLREIWSAFPEDCIGGANQSSAAPRTVTIRWNGSVVATTDLDGTKKLFRKRAWIRELFEHQGAREGDRIEMSAQGLYEYEIRFIRG